METLIRTADGRHAEDLRACTPFLAPEERVDGGGGSVPPSYEWIRTTPPDAAAAERAYPIAVRTDDPEG